MSAQSCAWSFEERSVHAALLTVTGASVLHRYGLEGDNKHLRFQCTTNVMRRHTVAEAKTFHTLGRDYLTFN